MEFINRAKGTIIENETALLFNLFLVKHKARKATLIEIVDLDKNYSPQDYVDIIKSIYNEFYYTIETMIGETIWRFFASNEVLDSPKKYKNKDCWVATVLEFHCKGIPDPNTTRYVLYYSVDTLQTNNNNFYAELYKEKTNIKSKLERFNSISKLLGWKVTETINKIYPDSIWLKSVINKGKLDNNSQWLIDNSDKLHQFIEGWGIVYFQSILIKDLLIKHYDWLLFTILRIEYDPFSIFYPLTNKDADILVSLDKKYFDLSKNPIDTFKNLLIDGFVIEKLTNAYLETQFLSILNNLVTKYEDLSDFIKSKYKL